MVELGLIGYPLGHSFSPQYFAGKFEELGIKGKYSLFPIDSIAELPGLLKSHPCLTGFNVTVPYKQTMIKYLDVVDPATAAIGAVNTVKIFRSTSGEVKLHGYNTDWIGFSRTLQPLIENKDIRKALILGTGGAAHAVGYSLRELDISPTFVSRDPGKSGLTPAISYDSITKSVMAENILIINTTPLGMSPNTGSFPSIPYGMITSHHILYDLVYNPLETSFMKRGREMGAKVKNGLDMLYCQADEAYKIWIPS